MYNRYQYTQKSTPEPRSTSVSLKNKELLIRKAHKRVAEWELDNGHLLKEILGESRLKAPELTRRKPGSRVKSIQNPSENPYFETHYSENLRKTDKSLHLGRDFMRVRYITEKERISLNASANSNIDITPIRSPKAEIKNMQKGNTLKNRIVQQSNIQFYEDPFTDPNFDGMFRKRMKSLELGKNFFVTTKIPTPKQPLLLTKKFDEFYSKLHNTNKVYKNSLENTFRINR